MPITFCCSGCQARLSIGSHKAGQSVTCPTCQARLTVPASSGGITAQPQAAKPDLAVFANLRESAGADGPDLPEVSLDPAASKKPVLTSTPPLPARYLVGGLAGLVVLCVLGYVVARNLGDDKKGNGEQVAGLSERPTDESDPPPAARPAASNPEGSSVITVPDLSQPKKEPPKPAEQPYTPEKKPEEKKPEIKPEEKKPEEKKPAEKQPEEKKPEEPKLESIIVKRRQMLDDEELRRQLLRVPELHIDSVARTSTTLLADAKRLQQLGQKYPGPQHVLLARRNDLAGLPMRMDPECKLGKEPAENMQVLSRKMRVLLQASIPQDGIDMRPDPETLKALMTGAKKMDAQDPRNRFLVRGLQPVEGRPQDWLVPEAVPVLMQMLPAENTAVRRVLIEVLSLIKGRAASVALANRAATDLSPEIREMAVLALKKRPAQEYTTELVNYLRYPWAPVADHAAEALVALSLKDALPAIVRRLNEPDLGRPITVRTKEGIPVTVMREMVKINHLGNCVLCHCPSTDTSDLVRGAVPTFGQPLPAPATTPQYYEGNRGGSFVRADITYLKQDFSVVQPVEKHGVWPANQRFDYLVRTRPPTTVEQALLLDPKPKPSRQREAMLFALRELSGRDLGAKPEDWYMLLPPEQRPNKTEASK